LEQAMQQFEGKVQLVLYPVAFRTNGAIAAQAAWCAGEQGKFWEFHHLLFRRQESWNSLSMPLDRLSDFAKDLQLDTTALKSCVESGRMQSRVQAHTEYGEQLQVSSAPTLFINDKRVVGAQSEGELVRLIGQELNRVKPRGQ
jgi:protein-disulfide isomerase